MDSSSLTAAAQLLIPTEKRRNVKLARLQDSQPPRPNVTWRVEDSDSLHVSNKVLLAASGCLKLMETSQLST